MPGYYEIVEEIGSKSVSVLKGNEEDMGKWHLKASN